MKTCHSTRSHSCSAFPRALLFSVACLFAPVVAEEDPHTIKNYWEALQKFDSELRERRTEEEVLRLCDQFGAYLEKMSASVASVSEFVPAAIKRELARLDLIKSEWLANPQKFARIQLDSEWVQAGEYKVATEDFRRVLGVKATSPPVEKRPELQEGFGEGAQVFGKPWLCPIGEFLCVFPKGEGIKPRNARVKVGMPGFPSHSLYYHSFDGDFNKEAGAAGGAFNRMYVVTDKWDRVVAVQFCCESPNSASRTKYRGISIFNFVQFRRKGSPKAQVGFETWKVGQMTKILTNLYDHGKVKEVNVLYLPEPTMELIRYNLSQR